MRAALTFEQWYQQCGLPYEQAVIRNGGAPWPMDPEKRAAIAERLGLPADTEPMDQRRALWERRKRSNQA